jgi:osmotically inducible lipoprotein OsmB
MATTTIARKFVLAATAAATLALTACGSDPLTRGVSGGLLGAGAGAGVAAVTGGRPATGALIGGGVGAAGGALTAH